jgi:preprotein translocase subunit SecE
MSSKSKRKHAQKDYNRANTGASADEIKEQKSKKTETGTAVAEPPASEIMLTETVLTPKEFRKIQAEKKKQAKIAQKLAKKQGKPTGKGDKKDKKSKKEKGERRNIFSGIASELKKVHWPSWNEAWKATGVVLGVVVVFAVVVFGIDRLLGWLYEMLIGGNK